MAETTSHNTEMTRDEMAAFLRSIADDLDSSDDVVSIQIGNKVVQLSPSDAIDAEATVTERSRQLRKDTEQVALTFKWNPVTDTAETAGASEPDAGAESEPEPDPGPETESGPDPDTER